MSGREAGHAVQVVSVEADGSYAVDLASVASVVQACAELPVCVVSVAGATRGGKSFLLDFFLRYLYASDQAREDGSWIGADDEPLTGFSWRGGADRDTTGILLWSQPIVVTQEKDGRKRKIAVLLMDTQGTFDHTSTVRDCTTIFAMSTLLSSVQIYNLAQLIKEDDLQHLQLFTEYGKLAKSETTGKPFQSLIFRVRDWMYPYELPYGIAGGQQHLNSVLVIKDNQKQELREIREQIYASFESVSCTLMPHPGFAVTDPNFSGRLCDLRSEFVDSLLEFIPSIFGPKNLVPKMMNGAEVKTGDLLTYFRSYMTIFNSDQLPTPVSILKATSEACLELAVSEARVAYDEHMRGARKARVPAAEVPRRHAAARQHAQDVFSAKNTLANPATANAKLQLLLQELDAGLPRYIDLNDAKNQNAVARARAAFGERLQAVRNGRPLCLHPLDLPPVFRDAFAAATAVFDEDRVPPKRGQADPERESFLQELERNLPELKASNEQANQAASNEAAAQYSAEMRRATRAGALSAAALDVAHAAAAARARALLAAARNRPPTHDLDPYMTDLDQKMEETLASLETANRTGNRASRQAALWAYNESVERALGDGCARPAELRRMHAAGEARALREFREGRAATGDDDEAALLAELRGRSEELARVNTARNEALVEAAYGVYATYMERRCTPSLASLLIVPWLIKVMVMLPKHHGEARSLAMEHFATHRRGSADEDDDPYYDDLKQKVAEGYNTYCNPLLALARELGVPLPQNILG